MEAKTIVLKKTLSYHLNLVIPFFAFVIPLFISGPQLLTGSLVNCFLFLSAARLNKKTQAIVAISPSIGALFNGLLFGKFTPFLAYFLPFIWIGNFILIKTFTGKNFLGIILSALLKSSFLFAFALIFFKLGVVPKVFLTAMGIFQFITAVIGGTLFIIINRFFLEKTKSWNFFTFEGTTKW